VKKKDYSARGEELFQTINSEIDAPGVRNVPDARSIRRKYSRALKNEEPELIIELAQRFVGQRKYRWIGYELLAANEEAFGRLGETEVEELGEGINSWSTVDTFARIISGPAWLSGQITDERIVRWARSEDFWWRRAALVSTVALNMRSQGGKGDVARTLRICEMLVEDHEDMVVKALSWALRELVVHSPEAVEDFLHKHESRLASRVKREVNNKLMSGLKNPRKSHQKLTKSTEGGSS